jgi:uncharacterized membrane protein
VTHAGSPGWLGLIAMTVAVLAFWALIVAGIASLLGPARSGWRQPHRADDPRRILDRRLARGEIDEREHARRRAALDSGPDASAG